MSSAELVHSPSPSYGYIHRPSTTRKLRSVSIRRLADTVSSASCLLLSCFHAAQPYVGTQPVPLSIPSFPSLCPPRAHATNPYDRATPFPSISLLARITNPDSIEFHVVFLLFFLLHVFSYVYIVTAVYFDAFQRSIKWENCVLIKYTWNSFCHAGKVQRSIVPL